VRCTVIHWPTTYSPGPSSYSPADKSTTGCDCIGVDTAEHEQLLRIIERTQRALGRGCRASEALARCTDQELQTLPQSSRGFSRLCSRYAHVRGALGRCLRVRTRRGETMLEIYSANAFELTHAETAQLYQAWCELQGELQRRSPTEIEAAREAAAKAWDVRCDERSFPCPWSNRPVARGEK
jgi:hypothetical protein